MGQDPGGRHPPRGRTGWLPFSPASRAEDLSPRTVDGYRLDLLAVCRWYRETRGTELRWEALGPTDLISYRQHLMSVERLRPATVNRRLQALRRSCRWARDRKILEVDPGEAVKSVPGSPNEVGPRVWRSPRSMPSCGSPESPGMATPGATTRWSSSCSRPGSASARRRRTPAPTWSSRAKRIGPGPAGQGTQGARGALERLGASGPAEASSGTAGRPWAGSPAVPQRPRPPDGRAIDPEPDRATGPASQSQSKVRVSPHTLRHTFAVQLPCDRTPASSWSWPACWATSHSTPPPSTPGPRSTTWRRRSSGAASMSTAQEVLVRPVPSRRRGNAAAR